VDLNDDITDPRLAKALAHPLRLEILRHLGDRTASPSEIAEGIGAPLTNVSYHVRKLRALGLIKLVKKTPKRGVIEHYYSANPRPTVNAETWKDIPDLVKEAMVTAPARRAAEEMLRSAASGGFNRSTAHFVRMKLKLDERGWTDAHNLLEKFYEDLVGAEKEASARIDASETEEVSATLLVGLFETRELPPAGGGGTKAAPSRTRKRSKTPA
jgi:DNA-binding transcriptional ArsR family regulator